MGGTVTVLCYGYWIRETGRTRREDLAVTRLDLGVGYLVTALFGMAMVIIASTVAVSGSGADLIVNLAASLEQQLGHAGRWLFLVGAWSAVFNKALHTFKTSLPQKPSGLAKTSMTQPTCSNLWNIFCILSEQHLLKKC